MQAAVDRLNISENFATKVAPNNAVNSTYDKNDKSEEDRKLSPYVWADSPFNSANKNVNLTKTNYTKLDFIPGLPYFGVNTMKGIIRGINI